MRLTTFTDYSLRVLIHVATAPEGKSTIAQVAAAFGISEHHLVKVVHLLGKEGLLVNTRGHGGGLQLGRAPARIRVGEVVRMTEGADIPAECFAPETNCCVLTGICTLQRALRAALDAFYGVLDGYTLEDLISNRRALATALSGAIPLRPRSIPSH